MIRRFHVKNYKALRDVSLELTPMHVLIGPNDSGKTSILEAIAALCRSVDEPVGDAFAGKWKGRELVWRGDANLLVSFDAFARESIGDLRYGFGLSFNPNGRTADVVSEIVESDVGPERTSTEYNPKSSVTRVAVFAQRNYSGGSAEEKTGARLVHDVLSGVQTYRWNPRFLALPNAPDSSRRFRMEPSGFGLALCLDDIMGCDRRLFDKLESRFKSIFPEVGLIQLLPEPAYLAPVDASVDVPMLRTSDGKGIHFQLANSGMSIPASQVSDGMLLVLAYLTILHLPEPPRVLLIEEPENGIHPARLKEVLTILRDLIEEQDHTQVLMTTHSPYVIDLFQPEEVTLCSKDEEGAVQTRRLSESKAVREQIDVFSLGEIWAGDGDERLMEPISAVTVEDAAE